MPFYPLKTPKIKILKNEKKLLEISSFIILHMCTKNQYHMMYGSWDAEWDRQFFVILGHFLSLYHLPPPMIPKIKILKKMKKMPGDIMLLYLRVYHKWRSYDIWFLKYKVQLTGHFGLFFTLSALWQPRKSKFYRCTTNDNRMMYGSRDIFCHFGPFFALLPS